MQLIKGKEIADNILNNIRLKIEKSETKPTLAVILIGNDKASEIYVGLKEKAARGIGMNFNLFKYDSDLEEEVVLNKIEEINEDENINGLIVQLPLPEKLDKCKIINAISPQKDVDGFCDDNQRCFFNNQETLFPVFPKAIIKMVESALEDLIAKEETPSLALPLEYKRERIMTLNKKAVIVCKSDDFGKIMQKALEKINIDASYFFCEDINNKENINVLKEADIVVSACGQLNLINSKMVKNDAIIIDGGIIKEGEKVKGDVDLESFKESKCLISPVPGGVGPVTVACLLENTFQAWNLRRIKNSE